MADTENSSGGNTSSRWFTIVDFPAPDGAEKINTLLFITFCRQMLRFFMREWSRMIKEAVTNGIGRLLLVGRLS